MPSSVGRRNVPHFYVVVACAHAHSIRIAGVFSVVEISQSTLADQQLEKFVECKNASKVDQLLCNEDVC